METIAVQIELVPRQFEQLQQLAHNRRLSPSAILELAINEWLDSQAKLERARLLMRELGQGLGEGRQSNDVASDHDKHLYGFERPWTWGSRERSQATITLPSWALFLCL